MSELQVSLQENLLTLLTFDKKACQLIINNTSVDLFDSSYYREIYTQAVNYYIEFKAPVGEHLPDCLEHILHGKDKRKSEVYEDIITNIYAIKDSINSEFVLNQLEKFVRQQQLKLGILQAGELIQNGKIDEAENALEACRKKRLGLFHMGTSIDDVSKIVSGLSTIENFIHLGIPGLDDYGMCPTPKELYLLMAQSGYGKSWFLNHVGKCALMQRKKVLKVTLELSEARDGLRFMQTLFGIAKNKVRRNNPVFTKDEYGSLLSIDYESISKDVVSLKDDNIHSILNNRIERLKKPQLIIKGFPSGQLSIEMLKAYLDNLENYNNFTPDVLLLDYPDIMKIDKDNLRIETGRIYVELRGIADERNLAMVCVTQTNRVDKNIKLLTREKLAEDISKINTADNFITYNQTEAEKARGLARLYGDKGRNDVSGQTILIAQNYSIGQFCLNSVVLDGGYDKVLTATPEIPREC